MLCFEWYELKPLLLFIALFVYIQDFWWIRPVVYAHTLHADKCAPRNCSFTANRMAFKGILAILAPENKQYGVDVVKKNKSDAVVSIKLDNQEFHNIF